MHELLKWLTGGVAVRLAAQDATLRQGEIRVLEEQPSYAEPGKKAVAADGHCEYSVRDLPGAR